jgi:hypothetical protein
MITLTVLAAGQMMFLLYDPFDMHLFAIASVLVSIAAIPVVLSTSPSPELPLHVELDIARLYRTSPSGAIACLTLGLADGAFWSLAPVFTAAISEDICWASPMEHSGRWRRCLRPPSPRTSRSPPGS